MVDPKRNGEYRTPRWVKWSVGIAIVLIIMVVSHFFIGGMAGLHSMPTGG